MSRRRTPHLSRYIPLPPTSNKYDKELGKAVHDPENYKGSAWASHWRYDLIDFGTNGHPVIAEINETRHGSLKHKVWGLGNPSIMEQPFLVALTGRNWLCPEEEKVIGEKIAVRMSELGIVMVTGFDKGTERRASLALRWAHGKQIAVPSYGIMEFKNMHGRRMRNYVDNSNILILSPLGIYDPWRLLNVQKRNLLIADLADALVGVQITDENAGGDLALKMLNLGKPVYLTESEGRASYCVKDHQFFVDKGAKEFKLHQLDYILNEIKEKKGLKGVG